MESQRIAGIVICAGTYDVMLAAGICVCTVHQNDIHAHMHSIGQMHQLCTGVAEYLYK